jgi:beta-phosphoglucomutase-like phosphatase (HAD superfamily)
VTEAREALRGARHILLDFDGPLSHVFAGLPAPSVARDLLALRRTHHVPVPRSVEELDDPLEIVRLLLLANDPMAAALERELTEAEQRAVACSQVTPYARDVIHACLATGRTVSIVSSNSTAALEKWLATEVPDARVYPVVGRPQDPRLMKPNPFPVMQALRALAAAPDSAVLVGDSRTDVEAAQAAGVRAIAYADKPGKRAMFESMSPPPNLVIDSMETLLAPMIATRVEQP